MGPFFSCCWYAKSIGCMFGHSEGDLNITHWPTDVVIIANIPLYHMLLLARLPAYSPFTITHVACAQEVAKMKTKMNDQTPSIGEKVACIDMKIAYCGCGWIRRSAHER